MTELHWALVAVVMILFNLGARWWLKRTAPPVERMCFHCPNCMEPLVSDADEAHLAGGCYFGGEICEACIEEIHETTREERRPPAMKIVVNGQSHTVEAGAIISYKTVLDLAYPSLLDGRTPSMTWKSADGRGGTLAPGQLVAVSDGMIFNTAHTGNA